MNKKKAYLILEDGATFQGYSFGSSAAASGEVVFNTAMTGYPESLTDPSYRGQILVMTYPMIGNYGVPPMELAHGLPKYFESDSIHIKALVVSDYAFGYSHWNAVISLDEWLKAYDIPAIYGVDTRQITKIIRERGVMLGEVVESIKNYESKIGLSQLQITNYEGRVERGEYVDPNKRNLVEDVSCREVVTYGSGDLKIVLVDCGCKYNIIRCLIDRGATVIRTPWDYDFTTLEYDGIMLSNGPGDPAMCGATVAHIQKAIAKADKPIFGICLGNQLLSLAAGATTYKLKYGHRGHNQPVLEVGTNHAVITSQNHGYAVDTTTLADGWEPYFINLNDGTNEGIRHQTKPFFSVQFHPEASSGPCDTEYLFDKFIALCKG